MRCVQEIEESKQAGDALSLTLDDLASSPADADAKQSDGRIILDDIDWDVISAQHGTRAAPQCLTKWYTQLAPSMVSKGNALFLSLGVLRTCTLLIMHDSELQSCCGFTADSCVHICMHCMAESNQLVPRYVQFKL